MRWPWSKRRQRAIAGPGLTTATLNDERAQADALLGEVHQLSVLAVRTELLMREHLRQLERHRQGTPATRSRGPRQATEGEGREH